MQHDILLGSLGLLAAVVTLVAALRQLHLPPILAYLGVGIIAGPHGMALLAESATIHLLGELGVMFLMFWLGLEFSLPRLIAARVAVFGGGGAQVLLTGGLTAGIAILLGLDSLTALFVGGALAMSSTAITLKQLAEQMEVNTRHGQLVVNILLFQDLATLPLLIALPIVAAGSGDLGSALLLAALKAGLVFAVIYFGGVHLMRPLIHWVAQGHSAELLMLTTLLLMLSAALLANVAGLSLPLGAFLAGMVIGETEFKHHIEADIRPFQDVLLGLFFITVGMQFAPAILLSHGGIVMGLLVLLILFKTLVIIPIGIRLGQHPGVALRAGISLAQSGEFGLLLLTQIASHQLLSPEHAQIILATMVLSMALAPVLIRANGSLAKGLNFHNYRRNLAHQTDRIAAAAHDLEGHIILCGYGRAGQNLAHFLELEGMAFLALEIDSLRVRQARAAGERVLYGDASRAALLQAAGIAHAQALVVTLHPLETALKVVQVARQLRPQLPILAQALDLHEWEQFRAAGASEVFPAGLEVNLLLGAQLLLLLGASPQRVEQCMDQVRGSSYCILRGYHRGAKGDPATTQDEAYPETLHTVRLPSHSRAAGKLLGELQLAGYQVQVMALRRGSVRITPVTDDTPLRTGDVLVLQGRPEHLQQAEHYLLS